MPERICGLSNESWRNEWGTEDAGDIFVVRPKLQQLLLHQVYVVGAGGTNEHTPPLRQMWPGAEETRTGTTNVPQQSVLKRVRAHT